MKKSKLCVLGCLLAGCALTVQVPAEEAQTESEQVPAEAAPAQRSSSLTTLVQRAETVRGTEELVWFEVAGQQRWLAKRPATGNTVGSVVLFASEQAGMNGLHHLANLRTVLPRHGWQTFFFNLEAAVDPAVQVLAAVAAVSGQGPLVLLCEGSTCEALRNLEVDGASARIYLNLPLSETAQVSLAYRNSWQAAAQPTLILQEFPQGWPEQLPLLAGYELHLMPAATAPRLDATVERKIRGWFKRRMQGA
ncbi:MAG: hypothetical protein ACFHXK_03670 [bacterium]